MVEHQHVLGETDRVVKRRGQDQCAELDPSRPRREPAQRQQRRDDRAAAGLMELRKEHRVEAGGFGRLYLFSELV